MHTHYNIRIATCAGPKNAREPLRELKLIDRGYLTVDQGKVVAMGTGEPPARWMHGASTKHYGNLITPLLVDCHTHTLFAGDRVRDFRDKMAGVPYQAIAARGGGIASTVRATHTASDAALHEALDDSLAARRIQGVGTVEIKTGYGGTAVAELRLLALLLRAQQTYPDIVPTYLALHGPPPDERASHVGRAGYLREMNESLSQAALMFRQAKREPVLDVYLDAGAYSLQESEEHLRHAKRIGFKLKGHVGQFEDLCGAEMLAKLGAMSCDHLEAVSETGLIAMQKADSLAVLLPGAWRTLRQVAPDAARMQRFGVRVAVATDFNPGTSPTSDLQLCVALAVRDAGLHPDAALLAITRRAADALGRPTDGRLALGAPARFAIWDSDDPSAFAYHLGGLCPMSVPDC